MTIWATTEDKSDFLNSSSQGPIEMQMGIIFIRTTNVDFLHFFQGLSGSLFQRPPQSPTKATKEEIIRIFSGHWTKSICRVYFNYHLGHQRYFLLDQSRIFKFFVSRTNWDAKGMFFAGRHTWIFLICFFNDHLGP